MAKDFSKEDVLIRGLKNGENDAFAYLVDRYHRQLCLYANSFTRNDLAAEDIVQNVLFMIWKKRHTLKDDFSVKNFMYKSVYNEFIDQYRKDRSVTALEQKYFSTIDAVVEIQDEQQVEEMTTILENAINDLPPKCKHIFILSKKEGLTNTEISEYLNISKKTIEAQMTKAFVILRKKLKGKFKTLFFLLFDQDAKQ